MTRLLRTRRLRAGLYELPVLTDSGHLVVWTAEQRQEDSGYGRAWLWFAHSDDGGALDPLPRLSDVKRAVTS